MQKTHIAAIPKQFPTIMSVAPAVCAKDPTRVDIRRDGLLVEHLARKGYRVSA